MICSKCKKQIDDDSLFCEHCGNRVSNVVSADDSKLGVGLSILSFLFPIVGFILYFVYKNSAYIKAKRAVKLAWIGFAVWVVLRILNILFSVGAFKETPTPADPYNGHAYVDLALSVKWATCNVGADSPEEYGSYFAWGETTPKTNYNWSTYKWCNGSYVTMTKYCTDSDYGTIDNKTVLDKEDDAATVNMGGSWRMPTKAEQDELRTECTWTWTTLNGVNGYNVEGPNGNSIFLPAAGYRSNGDLGRAGSYGDYWSSSLCMDNSSSAYSHYFFWDNVGWSNYNRFCGRSVRGVCP